jgi:hypothetical protein
LALVHKVQLDLTNGEGRDMRSKGMCIICTKFFAKRTVVASMVGEEDAGGEGEVRREAAGDAQRVICVG